MCFSDETFLPSLARFSTTFLSNCGRGVSLMTITCFKTVAVVSKQMLPVKYFSKKLLLGVSRISWVS